MKDKLAVIWAKVIDNKETVIRVGSAVAGAVIGGIVVAMIQNREELSHYPFYEEMSDQNDKPVVE